jgi:DNA-binding MarR family transcriptional regulator
MGRPAVRLEAEACAQAVRVCACQNLRSAARAVTRYFDERLHASGLRSTQFVVLAAIRAGRGPTLPRLAKDLVLDRSALTRSLGPLVRMGLVRLKASGRARATRATLTEKGERVLAETVALWKSAQDHFVAKLGAKRWNALLECIPATLEATGG